ncbi:(E)-beta-farnesene synthase-like protein [Tanacetum coccineum]|uniref:(E)-beta-farnesene synthase-like protein n=1 Tax=Tanacetum coccineum TaxID=301880 RepID=A0ABQ5CDB6_9ASTR
MTISSSPLSLDRYESAKQEVIRNTVNFHRSIWGDQFLTFDKRKDHACEEQRAKELKEKVRKELVITDLNELTQHVKLLELIDAVQRLGVAYHFEEEIEECLKYIYVLYGDQWISNNNLQSTSLWFRLLRQQGFDISSGIFNKYKNTNGDFMESLRDDVRGMLSLYEAAHMRVEGEEVLNEALNFTTYHLGNMVENYIFNNDDTSLEAQIHQALQQPLRKRLPRLEALRYIPIYQHEHSHNEALLMLAKLDFNLLQELHQKELSQISKWWKDLDVLNKLPYVRDRIVEGYFWILAVHFEPQHSDARIFLLKACSLVIILDDTYDNYGTYEELEVLTQAVHKWSRSCLDMLPEYMKVIYRELLDVHKEAEDLLEKKGKAYRSYYTKEMVKEYTRNLLIEAKWAKEGYIPTVEEHMSVALVTCAYAMIIAKCYVHGDDSVTEDTFKWVSTYPPLVKASCLILRLMDDIATHKEEQERNHVASSVECYMKQYGVSEEQTRDLFLKQVEDSWKVINQESLRPTDVPRPLLIPPINLARVCDVLYKRGDDYNHAGKEMIHYINSLLVDPLSM